MTPCGHSFSAATIEDWLGGGHQTCPMCNHPLTQNEIQPNYALRNAIQQFLSSQKRNSTPSPAVPAVSQSIPNPIPNQRTLPKAHSVSQYLTTDHARMGSNGYPAPSAPPMEEDSYMQRIPSTGEPTQPSPTGSRSGSMSGSGSRGPTQLAPPAPRSRPSLDTVDPATCRIMVEVMSARNLIKTDFFGKSDPYCLVSFQGKTRKTSTKKNTLCPTWNEVLAFSVKRIVSSDELAIRLYDKDRFSSDEFLGQVLLTMGDVMDQEHTTGWFPLVEQAGSRRKSKKRISGEVQLSLDFVRNRSPRRSRSPSPNRPAPAPPLNRSVSAAAHMSGPARKTSPAPGYADASTSSAVNYARLPPGWEQRRTSAGRTYYVNHADKSTHWTLPPSVAAQAERLSAQNATAVSHPPPGSQTSAYGAYFGQSSTQTRPAQTKTQVSVTTTSGGSAGATGVYELRKDPSSQRHVLVNHSEKKTSWAPQCDNLPYGWEARVDERGRIYFVHHQSRTTQWNRP